MLNTGNKLRTTVGNIRSMGAAPGSSASQIEPFARPELRASGPGMPSHINRNWLQGFMRPLKMLVGPFAGSAKSLQCIARFEPTF